MRILLWLRNDLRLHDHEPLHRALERQAKIIPLYCFDPRHFGQTAVGFPKTGAYRAKFLIETVADLRRSLQAKGSNLVIRQGKAEEEIPELVKTLDIDAVYWHEEVTQ
nr:deoxyribodipyrimidine photo-lyase [Leptolyngbya sp. BC1307]